MRVVEYVVPPETAKSWTEIMTAQVVFDRDYASTATAVMNAMREGLARDCKDVSWTPLSESDMETIFEWSRAQCSHSPAQYEMNRLADCGGHVCRWAYTTTHVPVDTNEQASDS